jgi:transposase
MPQMPSSSMALPYMGDIRKRWDEGQHNLTHLSKELQEQGFPGSYASLHRAVRAQLGLRDLPNTEKKPLKRVRISPRQAAWSLFQPESELMEKQKVIQQALCMLSTTAKQAHELAQEFRYIVKERQSEKLDGWLQQAAESEISEFKSFAMSLKRDYSAVKAALAYPWSNGQTEGQVNRLKLIKRQM